MTSGIKQYPDVLLRLELGRKHLISRQ